MVVLKSALQTSTLLNAKEKTILKEWSDGQTHYLIRQATGQWGKTTKLLLSSEFLILFKKNFQKKSSWRTNNTSTYQDLFLKNFFLFRKMKLLATRTSSLAKGFRGVQLKEHRVLLIVPYVQMALGPNGFYRPRANKYNLQEKSF